MSWEQHLGRLLIALRIDSIRRKIVALAVLATLVPATSIAVLSNVQNRRALTETLEGELRGIGSQAARELDLWVKERLYDARSFAGSSEVTESLERLADGAGPAPEALERLTDHLGGVERRSPDYAGFTVVDERGAAVASSRSPVPSAELPAEWMPRLRGGEAILGEPYHHAPSGKMMATVAQPVRTPDARFLGVLVATLDFGGLRDVLADFAPDGDGSIDLVVADGRRIVGSMALDNLELAVPQTAHARLREAEGGTIVYDRGDGEMVLGTLIDVPNLEWAVVTQLPTRQAYREIRRLGRSTALIVLGLMIFVGSVAYFLGLFIVRPLSRLAEAAAAVASGDLTVDLPVTGGGEVGYLTGVFNRMVGQLRRSREEVAAANGALRRRNQELQHLSMTDSLTGLYNRRYVMNELDKEVQRAERHGRSLAVLMLDVDRFKEYNDTYGHPAGDRALMAIGRVIEDATRDADVPGRFGGEEFIVLMPDCDIGGALDAAERIRTRLTEEAFEGATVTCSVGAAVLPGHGQTPAALIAAADVALYEAKAAGRDRVIAAGLPLGGEATGA
jgi:diguanylate cyclase (GGDEF)-like protein